MNIVPEITTKRLAVKVRPSAEKIIKQRHPWVFEDSIIKQNVEGEAGDLVIIYDTKKNTFLGTFLIY